MELHMRSNRLESGRPDWLAGAVAGFAAGAILMVLELLWAATELGGNPWITTHKIAAIVMGQDALRSMNEFNVPITAVALVIHYLLGIFTGLVVAGIVTGFHYDNNLSMVLLVGIVLGVVIYLINFYVLTAYFHWFSDLRGSATMLAHMIFGMAAAAMYWQFGRIER
jgi:hypothetical protein